MTALNLRTAELPSVGMLVFHTFAVVWTEALGDATDAIRDAASASSLVGTSELIALVAEIDFECGTSDDS